MACPKLIQMKIRSNQTLSQHALIVFLGIALLFGQTFSQHMHNQHDEVSANAGHIVDMHAASSLHSPLNNSHHHDEFQYNHHVASIDVSPDSFVKKTGSLNLLMLLVIVAVIVLSEPRLLCISRCYDAKSKHITFYYFLNPPLRAPPR